MAFALRYCPDGTEVLERLRRLYVGRAQDMALAAMQPPSAALAEFGRRHPPGFCAYPDPCERAAFWDAYLGERAAVHDDTIPSAYLSEMDQGLYGGLAGGEARFLCDPATGWVSSMVAPILQDWAGLDALRFDAAHPWFRRYLRQMEVFLQAAHGKFGLSHFILIDSLNFAFELVGATQTYLALIEQPERIRQAIDFAFDLNVTVQQAFFDRVPLLAGGTCSNMAQWMPGRIVSESVDPFHMTSVGYFERWGREPAERILSHFDGGVLHIHANGRHLLEAVSTLKGLKAIYLGDDKGFPPSFHILAELKARTSDLPLIVGVEYGDFCAALSAHRLAGGVFYMVRNVPDVGAANRCMDEVRAYRL